MASRFAALGRTAARATAPRPPRMAAPRLALGSVSARGYASSTEAAAQQAKSDAPWAITSLLVFGGMFIYLTAPPKGGKKHGHGHDSHDSHGKAGEDAEEGDGEGGDGDEEEEGKSGAMSDEDYELVDKVEGKPADDAPAGNQHLASQSMSAEEGAHLQKKTKDAPSGSRDNITFQKGVASAKSGHQTGGTDEEKRERMQSNPKKVVAEAHTERENQRAGKEEAAADDDE